MHSALLSSLPLLPSGLNRRGVHYSSGEENRFDSAITLWGRRVCQTCVEWGQGGQACRTGIEAHNSSLAASFLARQRQRDKRSHSPAHRRTGLCIWACRLHRLTSMIAKAASFLRSGARKQGTRMNSTRVLAEAPAGWNCDNAFLGAIPLPPVWSTPKGPLPNVSDRFSF